METLVAQEVRPFTMEQAIENAKNFSHVASLMKGSPLDLREHFKEREKNGLPPLYNIVAGIDIHTATATTMKLGRLAPLRKTSSCYEPT